MTPCALWSWPCHTMGMLRAGCDARNLSLGSFCQCTIAQQGAAQFLSSWEASSWRIFIFISGLWARIRAEMGLIPFSSFECRTSFTALIRCFLQIIIAYTHQALSQCAHNKHISWVDPHHKLLKLFWIPVWKMRKQVQRGRITCLVHLI